MNTILELQEKSVWSINHYIRRNDHSYGLIDILNLIAFLSVRDSVEYKQVFKIDGVTGQYKLQIVEA